MYEKVVRIADYERRSREPDAEGMRDPCNADVIVLPYEVGFDRAEGVPVRYHKIAGADY